MVDTVFLTVQPPLEPFAELANIMEESSELSFFRRAERLGELPGAFSYRLKMVVKRLRPPTRVRAMRQVFVHLHV